MLEFDRALPTFGGGGLRVAMKGALGQDGVGLEGVAWLGVASCLRRLFPGRLFILLV
jgi:hypothetical protein